jgi:hypothetical protein
MLRMVLAHAQPSDWLVGPAGDRLPLHMAVGIFDPVAAQALLDVIVESPGGFPAHAVAASPGILHRALQFSTASFVAALRAAGVDPAASKMAGAKPLTALTPTHCCMSAPMTPIMTPQRMCGSSRSEYFDPAAAAAASHDARTPASSASRTATRADVASSPACTSG